MDAFQAAFVPSKLRRGLSLLLHLAAAACARAYFGGLLRVALLIGLAAAAYWSWRESPRRVRTLTVDPQGRAAIDTGAGSQNARLLGGSLISRHACFLHWDCGNRRFWQCVLPDSTDADSLRRLMVWARFGQPENDNPPPDRQLPR